MKYLWTLPQIIFLALFDVVFFLNDTSAYTDGNWWCFALLHTAFVLEIVSLILLKKLKTLPFSKKTHPIIAFMVVFLCHVLVAALFCLIPNVDFTVVLIANFALIGIMLVLLGYLLLVQLYRVRKEEKKNPKPKKEKPAPPEKLKSTALADLQTMIEESKELASLLPPEEHTALKELAELATPYTYEELEYTEKELKKQQNLLKTLLTNDDTDAIMDAVEDIKSVLASRESQIAEVEKDTK